MGLNQENFNDPHIQLPLLYVSLQKSRVGDRIKILPLVVIPLIRTVSQHKVSADKKKSFHIRNILMQCFSNFLLPQIPCLHAKSVILYTGFSFKSLLIRKKLDSKFSNYQYQPIYALC